jgi:biotin carboxylase
MYFGIVDAYSTGRFLPAALRRRGFECVHIRSSEQVPDFYRESLRADDFSETIVHHGDPVHTSEVLAKYDPAFVVPGHESGVELADVLSHRLGLSGNGFTRSAARRDKYLMAEAVRMAGLAAPEAIVTASEREAIQWALVGDSWPLVLKPVASAGSDNVVFCDSVRKLRTAFRRILDSDDVMGRRNREVLVQQFLDGTEYFVNTVSVGGRHHVAEIWRYVKRLVPGGGFIYDWEEPLPYDGAVQSELRGYVTAVLGALDIRYGPAHTEVMLTRHGPVLVESGARLAGSIIPAVVSRVFGTDQVELTAQAYAAPADFARHFGTEYRLRTHLRYVSLISPVAGKVRSLEPFARIRSLPSFADMSVALTEGGPLRRTVDSRTSPGYVYLVGDKPAQLEADYRAIRKLEMAGLYDVE